MKDATANKGGGGEGGEEQDREEERVLTLAGVREQGRSLRHPSSDRRASSDGAKNVAHAVAL